MKRILWAATLLLALHGLAHAGEVELDRAGLTLKARLETGPEWPRGPVVLMTHGTLAHGRMEIMTALQQAFSERGLSSLAISLSLGLPARQGMYDCATPHRHRHADALDEIDAWMDWLARQGVAEVVLLGHSRGGNQAAWYASERDRPALDKLLLLAPMTWDAAAEATAYRQRYGAELGPLLGRMQALVDGGQADAMQAGVDFIYCQDTQVTPAAFVAYYGDDPRRDTPTLLPRLAKPALVIAGSEDQVVKGLAARVQPVADGARVRLEVIDGADHFFRDLYADDVADLAVAFIQDD